ncbi:hypothetical protein SY83_14355 [Paenibacillus swuensis]|uniref:4,4'-diaponeurosporenoate glycosyltransferase n=1 Tax=Paenibacillus swuensis TaxID=1178515 RepID=A0A172TK13_9BACL|nr:glycosyltransferase [Paenibacillus swuensis]ANE47254.1 hypothetical protein SY83_14355 [Paenibacillus swuensis]
MESFLWVITALLTVQLMFVIWNTAQFPKAVLPDSNSPVQTVHSGQERMTKVSILIPARDEERNIDSCLRSVSQQRAEGLDYEIIVLNDRSSDKTGTIAEEYARKFSRIRVLEGREPAAGWTGKSYACHQLAEEATGDILFFMDADARLEPGALSALTAFATRQGSGIVSGFPRQETETLIEKLVVPMMMYTISCHLPVALVHGTHDPKFAAAHGAALLIHRDTYRDIGGHAAVRSDLVDDMAIVRKAKEGKHPVSLIEMYSWVRMRMYRNGSEVWNGYKKNLFPGVGRNPVIMAGILSIYTILYLVPPLMLLPALFFANDWIIPAILSSVLAMLTKSYSDRKNGLSGYLGLAIALSAGILICIALDSWLSSGSGKGYEWKGRRYL